MNASEFAARCRRIANKIEQYANKFGEKTGWDSGLHSFMAMLEPIEALIDQKIENAANGASEIKAQETLTKTYFDLKNLGMSDERIRGMFHEIAGNQ